MGFLTLTVIFLPSGMGGLRIFRAESSPGQVITKDTLIVGEAGKLIADINAGTVICKGKIEGTVTATDRIELHSTGQIVGEIKAKVLQVEVGGVLDGQCDMSGQGDKIVELRKNADTEVGTG